MSDATAAMNDATSGELVRNRQKHQPEQRPLRQRRSRLLAHRRWIMGASSGQIGYLRALSKASRS
jgi:hypothetical protein